MPVQTDPTDPTGPAAAAEVQTAVIVAVPEAEALVGPWRARLDPAAGWGVPAHITVLYPFLAAEQLGARQLSELAEVVAGVPPFEVNFARTSWFGRRTLWLAPDPGGPFHRLAVAVYRHYPQCPPYGGEHPDFVPHLTIGTDAPLAELERAERAVAAGLPLRARVTALQVIAGSQQPDSWRTVGEISLDGR